MRWKKITVIVILVAILPSFVVSKTFGQTSSSINASIRISICGNGIIEGGEDCEGTNLNNKTCQSLGYSSGTLSCDISCSFDTNQCIATTPTPTPTSTPTPSPMPTPIQTIGSTQSTSQDQEQTYSFFPTTTAVSPSLPESIKQPSFLTSIISSLKSFPKALVFFGADKNGTIKRDLVYVSVKSWVQDWQKFLATAHVKNGKIINSQTSLECDINGDGICGLNDFSIMMYHVQP